MYSKFVDHEMTEAAALGFLKPSGLRVTWRLWAGFCSFTTSWRIFPEHRALHGLFTSWKWKGAASKVIVNRRAHLASKASSRAVKVSNQNIFLTNAPLSMKKDKLELLKTKTTGYWTAVWSSWWNHGFTRSSLKPLLSLLYGAWTTSTETLTPVAFCLICPVWSKDSVKTIFFRLLYTS